MLCPKCNAMQPDGRPRCGACGCSLVNANPTATPRQRRRLLPAILATSIALVAYAVLTGSNGNYAKTPEEVVMLPVKALRANNLSDLFATMSRQEWNKTQSEWNTFRKQENPMFNIGFDQAMTMLNSPGAVNE